MDNLKLISKIIQERRTISPSSFSDQKIDEKLILQLLENAHWAPNHRNTEPWRFKIYTDGALQKLAVDVQTCYQKHCPPEKFSHFKMTKMGKKINASSHVIIICMERHIQSNIPEWEELAAVACAVQNLWLSATAANLVGYWSSPRDILDNANEFLSLNEHERCLGFFYLGHPKSDISVQSSRSPLDNNISWHRQ